MRRALAAFLALAALSAGLLIGASAALARRGYSWGEIHAALRRCGAEIEEE